MSSVVTTMCTCNLLTGPFTERKDTLDLFFPQHDFTLSKVRAAVQTPKFIFRAGRMPIHPADSCGDLGNKNEHITVWFGVDFSPKCCIVGNWTSFSSLKTFHLSSKRLLQLVRTGGA